MTSTETASEETESESTPSVTGVAKEKSPALAEKNNTEESSTESTEAESDTIPSIEQEKSEKSSPKEDPVPLSEVEEQPPAEKNPSKSTDQKPDSPKASQPTKGPEDDEKPQNSRQQIPGAKDKGRKSSVQKEFFAAKKDYESQISSLQESVKTLTTQLADARRNLSRCTFFFAFSSCTTSTRHDKDAFKERLDHFKNIEKELNDQIFKLKETLQAKNNEISSLRGRVDRLNKQLRRESQVAEAANIQAAEATAAAEAAAAELRDIAASPVPDHGHASPRTDDSQVDVLTKQVRELRRQLQAEKDRADEALDAWENAGRQLKHQEQQLLAHQQELEENINRLSKTEVEMGEKLNQRDEELERQRSELREIDEENANLRVRLGGIQSEIKGTLEMEKMRASVVVETIRSEVEWRERLLIQRITELQSQNDDLKLKSLKLERALKQVELSLVSPDSQGNIDGNRATAMFLFEQRKRDLSEIDHSLETAQAEHQMSMHQNQSIQQSAVAVGQGTLSNRLAQLTAKFQGPTLIEQNNAALRGGGLGRAGGQGQPQGMAQQSSEPFHAPSHHSQGSFGQSPVNGGGWQGQGAGRLGQAVEDFWGVTVQGGRPTGDEDFRGSPKRKVPKNSQMPPMETYQQARRPGESGERRKAGKAKPHQQGGFAGSKARQKKTGEKNLPRFRL